MIESIVGSKERRGEIVVALCDKDVQERILRHGSAQRFGDVDVAVFIWRIIPGSYTPREDFIGQVAVELEIVARVIVEHAGIGPHDGGDAGVEFRLFPSRIPINAEEARVDAPDGAAL